MEVLILSIVVGTAGFVSGFILGRSGRDICEHHARFSGAKAVEDMVMRRAKNKGYDVDQVYKDLLQ